MNKKVNIFEKFKILFGQSDKKKILKLLDKACPLLE